MSQVSQVFLGVLTGLTILSLLGAAPVFALSTQPASNQVPSAVVVENPAWDFQNQFFGTNSSGTYAAGTTIVDYTASYFGDSETFTVSFPMIAARSYVSTLLSNGSYEITASDGSTQSRVINPFVVVALASTDPGIVNPQSQYSEYFWQYGAVDNDTTTSVIAESLSYEYIGGSYPYTSNTLAMWLGLTTNQGIWIQVTTAWGYVNCGDDASSIPAFSVGWSGNETQCPVPYDVVKGHTYTFGINYDEYITGDWYVYIYDETAGSYVTDQASNATGTYIPQGNALAAMEGVASTPQGLPDGSDIPYGYQLFTNPMYYTQSCSNPDCVNTYNWINWWRYNSPNYEAYVAPPSNAHLEVTDVSYITEVCFYYSSC